MLVWGLQGNGELSPLDTHTNRCSHYTSKKLKNYSQQSGSLTIAVATIGDW
jgi:hypothetical protein